MLSLQLFFTILGWYWIDPNLGMPDDAVYVFCNLTAMGETCIYPDKDRAVLPSYIQWRKEDDNDWYSNLKDGFQVTYDSIGSVQMTFLRLLSEEGYQNFTYKCINSAAWFNAELKNFDSAIKFMGDNEMEIGYDTDKLKPNVLVDGCEVNFQYFFGSSAAKSSDNLILVREKHQ